MNAEFTELLKWMFTYFICALAFTLPLLIPFLAGRF
jgi:hypothetical protein